jgi:hypothetical protein
VGLIALDAVITRRRALMQALVAALMGLLVAGIVGRFSTASASLLLICILILGGVFLSPEFALGFAILAQTNFLGVIDPELFGIPGLFKVSDLAFVFLAVPLVEDLATRRFQISRLRTALFGPVALIIGLALLNIVLSYLREGVPLSLGFRIGRRYIFYGLFFVAFYSLTEPRRLQQVLQACRLAGAVAALVVVTVFFTGSETLSAGMVTGEFPTAEDFTRPYSPAFPLIILAFFDSLARTLVGAGRDRWTTACVLGITTVGILVDLSRNGWMAVILGSAWMWWAMRRGKQFPRWRALRLGVGAAVALAVLSVFAGQIAERRVGDALEVFFARFTSTFVDLSQVGGTFGERIEILTSRVRLMTEEPTAFLWGLGFATSQLRAMELAVAADVGGSEFALLGGENGVATVLAELGGLGLIAVIWFTGLVMHRGYRLATCSRDAAGRVLGPALAACHLCYFVQFLSLSSLSFAYGPYVMVTGLLMAIIERQYGLSVVGAMPLGRRPDR